MLSGQIPGNRGKGRRRPRRRLIEYRLSQKDLQVRGASLDDQTVSLAHRIEERSIIH